MHIGIYNMVMIILPHCKHRNCFPSEIMSSAVIHLYLITHQLSSVNFSSLLKVYSGLQIYNNSLDLASAFPCEMYVFYNDGLDCSPGDIEVSNNGNDNYCFQDLSLRDDPGLSTVPITEITAETATSGGVITSNSFVQMKSKGVCWSTNPNPTIADTFSENGNFNDDYTSFIYNLSSNTTYYVRAYVEDCNGFYYGDELSFTHQLIRGG